MCFQQNKKDVTVKVFNMTAKINEAKTLEKGIY